MILQVQHGNLVTVAQFNPAPSLWPGEAVEDDGPKHWDPAPVWETMKRLLDSDQLSSGRCGHLGE